MAFYIFNLQFYKKVGKRRKEDDSFLRKETEEKQSSTDITISVYGKRTVCPVKLELEAESSE